MHYFVLFVCVCVVKDERGKNEQVCVCVSAGAIIDKCSNENEHEKNRHTRAT